MAEYFETDEIVKDLDTNIVKRIFSYVKPYKSLIIITTIALILTSLGELFIPVLVQHTVDDALVRSYSLFDSAIEQDESLKTLPWKEGIVTSKGIFVKKSFVAKLTKSKHDELVSKGLLSTGLYYLCEWNKGMDSLPVKIQADILKTNEQPDLKTNSNSEDRLAISGPLLSETYFVAPSSYITNLSGEDAKSLRAFDITTVQRNVAIFFVSLLIVLVATFVQIWSSNLIGQKVMVDLRMDLFNKTVGQSLHFLSLQPVGRLVTRLTSDVETINEFFSNVVVSFIKDFSIMLGVLVTLFILNPRLGLICMLSLPPVLIATSISRIKARDAFRKQRTWLSKVNAFISEHISGVNIVKLFNQEQKISKDFASHNKELLKANLGEMYVYATFRPVIEFFASTSTAIILYFGAGFHDSGLVSLGTLIAFINLIRMFYSPLQDIAEKFTILQNAMAGGERVFKLLDTDEKIINKPIQSLAKPIKGKIEFDHVWFAYKNEDWVIKDLSFTVEPGQSLAIVGYTGSGKTTLGLLLTRMWDVQKGEIRLDGIPIKKLALDELRSAIRPVMQDVFLFSGTINENIALGLNLSQDEIIAAARNVSATDFIEKLPEGFNSKLGEGAGTLSSGQRQLLSFARVVAHNPAIVMLDEATSSIDSETEKLVQKGLEALLKGRTSIAIAHRLSTIKKADKIIVLSKGRLIEEGKHEELISKQGLYFALYQLQYESEEEGASDSL